MLKIFIPMITIFFCALIFIGGRNIIQENNKSANKLTIFDVNTKEIIYANKLNSNYGTITNSTIINVKNKLYSIKRTEYNPDTNTVTLFVYADTFN